MSGSETGAERVPVSGPASGQEEDPVRAARTPTVTTAISRPFSTGFVLTLGGLLAVAAGTAFSHLSAVIIYVAFALFAALGLDPLVRWLERRRVRRPWGIVVVYAGFLVIVAGVVVLVVPTLVQQTTQVVAGLPQTVADFEKSDVYAWLHDTLGAEASTMMSQLTAFLTQPAHIATIGRGVLQVGMTIVSTTSGVVVVLVLSLYFLASMPAIKTGFNRFAPARNRARVASMTDQITDSVGGYLVGMVVLAFCNSVIAFLLHLILGLPFPLLMAVAAFCITLIPLVGSVMYWAGATALALFTGWVPAVIFAGVYLVYMQVEAYVLTPRVMSRAISVPGALVVIGALVGGTLLGLLGALVAIPVTASILLIVKQVVLPRQDAKV